MLPTIVITVELLSGTSILHQAHHDTLPRYFDELALYTGSINLLFFMFLISHEPRQASLPFPPPLPPARWNPACSVRWRQSKHDQFGQLHLFPTHRSKCTSPSNTGTSISGPTVEASA